jgi:hypothetical protein
MLMVDVPALGVGTAGALAAGRVSRFELALLVGAAIGFLVTLADRLRRGQ